MFINVGLNKVRDLIAAEVSKAIMGTDGTAPTETDTGLIAPVTATEKTPTVTKYDKMYAVKYFLGVSECNGNTFKEFGTKATDGTYFDRTTFYDIVKDSTFEVHIRKRYYIRNG